jgi:hypothetical protein
MGILGAPSSPEPVEAHGAGEDQHDDEGQADLKGEMAAMAGEESYCTR